MKSTGGSKSKHFCGEKQQGAEANLQKNRCPSVCLWSRVALPLSTSISVILFSRLCRPILTCIPVILVLSFPSCQFSFRFPSSFPRRRDPLTHRRTRGICSTDFGTWWMKSWTWGGRCSWATSPMTAWGMSSSTSQPDWTGATSEWKKGTF